MSQGPAGQATRGSDRQRTTSARVIALSIGLVVYSSTVHLVPNFNLLYVPLGLGSTAALAIVAREWKLDRSDLGLARSDVAPGLRLGLAVAAVAGCGLLVATALPWLHPLFADERVADFSGGLVAYRALIRIPLGTALLEEFAFRGVLFGVWQRAHGTRAAAIGSSLVFGLWHIRPAIDLVNANDVSSAASAQAGIVLASVLLTTIAGVFFCVLRLRSRSLLAPFLAHAGINSFALVAAAIVAASA